MNADKETEEARGFRKLRENPDSLQSLLDTIACGIVTVDTDGCLAFTNASARRMLCRGREDLIGHSFAVLPWHNQDGTPIPDEEVPLAITLRNGEEVRDRIVHIPAADGGEEKQLFISMNTVPLRDRKQRLCGAAADFVDVSEAVRARREREKLLSALGKSETRYRMLAESAPVGVFECDGNGSWLYTNPRWEVISGLSVQESLGHGWQRVLHPADQDWILREFCCADRPEVAEWVCRILHPSGKTVWVRVLRKEVACEEPKETHFVGTISDITAQKEAERHLHRAKEAAEEANQAKGRFLQVVSHEIRTPMTVFMGMVDLAMSGPLNDQQRSYLQASQSAADTLLALIEDILLYSELESGRLAIERVPFDLPACVQEALQPIAAEAARRGIGFYLNMAANVPQTITGDPQRLRQVLKNLAGNAVRFTRDGEVKVQVNACTGCLPKFRHGIRFAVYDTGCGIPEDKLDRLFQAFGQLDASTTRRHGGTGLGLALSKEIVQAMQGKIEVESRIGKGSVFSFTIPMLPGGSWSGR